MDVPQSHSKFTENVEIGKQLLFLWGLSLWEKEGTSYPNSAHNLLSLSVSLEKAMEESEPPAFPYF